MDKEFENDYQPFGPEWEKEVSRMPKAIIIKQWAKACQKRQALEEAASFREQPLREALEKVKQNLSGWEDTDTMMGIALKTINTALASEGDGIYLTKSELEKKISDAWDAGYNTQYAGKSEHEKNKTEYLTSKQL